MQRKKENNDLSLVILSMMVVRLKYFTSILELFQKYFTAILESFQKCKKAFTKYITTNMILFSKSILSRLKNNIFHIIVIFYSSCFCCRPGGGGGGGGGISPGELDRETRVACRAGNVTSAQQLEHIVQHRSQSAGWEPRADRFVNISIDPNYNNK